MEYVGGRSACQDGATKARCVTFGEQLLPAGSKGVGATLKGRQPSKLQINQVLY